MTKGQCSNIRCVRHSDIADMCNSNRRVFMLEVLWYGRAGGGGADDPPANDPGLVLNFACSHA